MNDSRVNAASNIIGDHRVGICGDATGDCSHLAREVASDTLAAADEVEQPIARRLADMLRATHAYLFSALDYRENIEALPKGTLTERSGAGLLMREGRALVTEYETER